MVCAFRWVFVLFKTSAYFSSHYVLVYECVLHNGFLNVIIFPFIPTEPLVHTDQWSDQYMRYWMTQITSLTNMLLHTTPEGTPRLYRPVSCNPYLIQTQLFVHLYNQILLQLYYCLNHHRYTRNRSSKAQYFQQERHICYQHFMLLPVSDPIWIIISDSIHIFLFNFTPIELILSFIRVT